MPALKEGILINQPAPRPYRANRRPLYIAIGALSAVSFRQSCVTRGNHP